MMRIHWRHEGPFTKPNWLKRNDGYDMNVNEIEKDFLGNIRNGAQESYRWIIGDV